MKHLRRAKAVERGEKVRDLVNRMDRYTDQHGPAPLIAELARSRRAGFIVSFCAGVLA